MLERLHAQVSQFSSERLAQTAQRYQSAAAAAHAALQRQQETIRRMQFTAARARAEMHGSEAPADGWDRVAERPRLTKGDWRAGAAADLATASGVRRLVAMHAAERRGRLGADGG